MVDNYQIMGLNTFHTESVHSKPKDNNEEITTSNPEKCNYCNKSECIPQLFSQFLLFSDS